MNVLLSRFHLNRVLPENIHTSPTGGINFSFNFFGLTDQVIPFVYGYTLELNW